MHSNGKHAPPQHIRWNTCVSSAVYQTALDALNRGRDRFNKPNMIKDCNGSVAAVVHHHTDLAGFFGRAGCAPRLHHTEQCETKTQILVD